MWVSVIEALVIESFPLQQCQLSVSRPTCALSKLIGALFKLSGVLFRPTGGLFGLLDFSSAISSIRACTQLR